MVESLKTHFWGTPDIILHSSGIRKHDAPFSFLGDYEKRQEFYTALNELIASLEFTIIAVVILKNHHSERYGAAASHPYHLSLRFIVERYALFLQRRGKLTEGYMMSESRGKREDVLLKNEFRNLMEFGTDYRRKMSNITTFWMRKKADNIAGLQIADLLAYPIAVKVLYPDRENKAFDILVSKFDSVPSQSRNILGYGLKIFPAPTSAHRRIFAD